MIQHADPAAEAVPPRPAAREMFTVSRALEFFSVKELQAQTGHAVFDWPNVAFKELADNALDACEEAGVPPELTVTVAAWAPVDGAAAPEITVADNGPGIEPEVVDKILDFGVRVSSREAYAAPDRGAQGNALKTLIGMPYALDEQGGGGVEIDSRGVGHVVHVTADRIRQMPVVEHLREDGKVKNGTSVKVRWPARAWLTLCRAQPRFLSLAQEMALFNPHLSLALKWNNKELFVASRTDAGWSKWGGNRPTCAAWYDLAWFIRRIAASVAADAANGRDRSIREFAGTFFGLSGVAKRTAVVRAAGMERVKLSALVRDGQIDRGRAGRLLAAMKDATRAPKPHALGVLGKDHVERRFGELGAVEGTFEYRKAIREVDGLPYVAEVAFAVRDAAFAERDESGGEDAWRLFTGCNFSPAIHNPFQSLGRQCVSLHYVLGQAEVECDDAILCMVHLVCPRLDYGDRGKSSVVVPEEIGDAVVALVASATKRWTKQKKAETRDAARRARRSEMVRDPDRVSVRDAAYAAIPAGYAKASSNGKLPALARAVMYACRPAIQAATGKPLNDKYFTQTLLPAFLRDHPKLTAEWDVVLDARGNVSEPHTGTRVPLGTLQVRTYLASTQSPAKALRASVPRAYPTRGPKHRFGAALFVEKELFEPVFKATQLMERYDLALLSTKGLSTVAARHLVDEICDEEVPLLVLHDFDKSGFSILGTLRSDTLRYAFRNKFRVIDLGLRLPDVRKWKLEAEEVVYGKNTDPRPNLRHNGATKEEVKFLCARQKGDRWGGLRVELNAFTSAELIEWLEEKFAEHGIGKVVPGRDVLEDAYRRNVQARLVERRVEQVVREAGRTAAGTPVPHDLMERVNALLAERPEMAWDAAVAEVVDGGH